MKWFCLLLMMGAQSEDPPVPPDAGIHEMCRDRAHRAHCDCYSHCGELDDPGPRDMCKQGCEDAEQREMARCDAT